MTEIEEELIATLADVRRARNEAADLVVRTARERDAALARAEAAEAERDAAHRDWQEAWDRATAAEAERDAANALGAETTVQLKSAQYHLGVMVKAWEAAEARIAAMKECRYPFCPNRAALAEPVEPISLVGFAVGEPQPSACTTCGGEKWVDDPTWALADELPPYVPCPSCASPDPTP